MIIRPSSGLKSFHKQQPTSNKLQLQLQLRFKWLQLLQLLHHHHHQVRCCRWRTTTIEKRTTQISTVTTASSPSKVIETILVTRITLPAALLPRQKNSRSSPWTALQDHLQPQVQSPVPARVVTKPLRSRQPWLKHCRRSFNHLPRHCS